MRSPTDIRVRNHCINTLFVFGLLGLAAVMAMTEPYLEMTEPLRWPAVFVGNTEGRLHRVNIYKQTGAACRKESPLKRPIARYPDVK